MSPVETLNNPLPDFSDPFGLLQACHNKLKLHCDMLERAALHLETSGIADNAFHATIEQVIRYFSTAAILHHQDEEEDIFPLVIRNSVNMTDLVSRLKAAHEELEKCWLQTSAALQNDELRNEPQHFIENARLFVELNRKHIQLEEEDFLPQARQLIGGQQLENIGKAMAKRRNVSI